MAAMSCNCATVSPTPHRYSYRWTMPSSLIWCGVLIASSSIRLWLCRCSGRNRNPCAALSSAIVYLWRVASRLPSPALRPY